jgi:adenylate cyclase
MGVEIERKFLVRRDAWPGSSVVTKSTRFKQGYLSRERGRTVRVRRAGERAFLTIKGEIPLADAAPLLAMCTGSLIDKERHLVEHEGHTWEVDEFLGANAGLWVAEIELAKADEAFARPAWVGDEVTDDRRYLNSNLVEHPYSEWHQA